MSLLAISKIFEVSNIFWLFYRSMRYFDHFGDFDCILTTLKIL